MDHVTVVRAEELVVADQRQGDLSLPYAEALQAAVDGASRVPVYGDDALADAYRVVLATRVPPTREELIELVIKLGRGNLTRLSLAQEVWLWQARRGVLR